MSRLMEPTMSQIGLWDDWVSSRPECVRKIAEKLDPWTLYRLKSTGQRVTLYSISENETVTVTVSGEFNSIIFERNVFGISPNDLEPCELPAENEILGTII